MVSFEVTSKIRTIGAGSVSSCTLAVTVTGTICLSGGEIMFGDALMERKSGAVVSEPPEPPLVISTVKLPPALLKCASVAVQFTLVVPTANVDPDAGEQLTATLPSTRSEAVALNVTCAPFAPVAG